ncbi:DNA recombination protein RmuC [Patescibacteria group bacterium]|nr:DNA recombination protein RmuC [Patescibacteria group bacterium]
MEYLIILLLVLVIIGLGLMFFLFFKKKPEEKDGQSMLMLQQQMNQLSQVLDNKLSESSKAMQTQFGQSAKIIQNVTEKLTKLDDTNKQVVGFAEQLQSLENILTNPKQRGILGEYFLETVLKNVLPPDSYKIQYSFKDGTIVDAVVFIDKQIIPIDSKFSLENYNRILDSQSPEEKKRYEAAFINDLKFRIDETSKYVKPEEKTMDFAFMYIPSEAVYYDLLINKVGVVTGDTNNLVSYAGRKKVIIVSPTSFLAYLQTVLQGLRRQKISEQALGIIKEVERLGKHMGAYSQYMQKLGNHLTTTVGSYNKASKELKKIDKDVVKITDGRPQIEMEEVEKPKIE